MKRGIVALLVAVFLSSVGTVRAAIVTDLVSNGGFEGLVTSSPNVADTPWFSTEGNVWELQTEASTVHAGSTAVAFQYYYVVPSLVQNIGTSVEVGKAYEINLWHAIGEASGNATHTADSSFTVSIWTSPSVGGTYTEASSITGIQSSSAEGVYENYIGIFPALDLVGVVGEYIQIRVEKEFINSHYRIFVDDVSFGISSIAGPTTLATDPADELALYLEEGSSTVTGAVAVSYIEGSPAGNVTISSVSVVDQSPAGGFANVTSLPLTLTSPVPYSDAVLVEFDNATPGLTVGQTATGMVEIVWNVVGSGSSATSTVPVSVAVKVGAGNIIAAFDDIFTTADRKFFGVDAAISGGSGPNVNYGSTDTSYGSVFGDAPTAKNAMGATVNNPTVVVSITNTTPDTTVVFDSLNFDVGRRWSKAPNTFTVGIAGDIDNNASFASHTGFTELTVASPYLDDYDDFDIDLTGLSDRSLSFGESAEFTITVSDPIDVTNPNSVLALDNIALLGSVISDTLLVTDPAYELALNVNDPLGVVTGTVAVSYIEASSLPTNVIVTAVSIVSQSLPGSFANATTNLPFTLSDPAASEDVLVEFNNGTAGLTAGQTATGIVEIVWNEVGSASSATSTVAVSAMYLDVNPGNTIAIFDHRSENANPRLGGLDATLSGYQSISSDRGSNDGTYGTRTGDARTDKGCVQGALSYPVISMAITNNTGYPCTFDSLHFDAARGWTKGPKTVTVSISGDVTANASLFTNPTDLPETGGQLTDYPDFDVPLTGLADRTLAHGEVALIEFTWSNGDLSNTNAVSILDNIALLGSGVNGAVLTKVPGGEVVFGVSGLDLGASELIEMIYTEGDAATNVVITGVTVSEETHAGAFSYFGSFPTSLTEPDSTNEIFTALFDNTVANLAAGETASAVMEIAWYEIGAEARTFDLPVYATRPADVPTSGVIALLDTEFLTADAAVNGVLAHMGGEGSRQYVEDGSDDGTYGSLATPAAPTGTSRWRISGENNVATLTVSNGTAGDIVLSTLNFDIGRWYASGSDEFKLSVSGDVTDTPALLVSSLSILGWPNLDFQDVDVDLSTLADHTLAAGESLAFTITLTPKAGAEGYNTWIDNIALIGDFDLYGGWGASGGLTPGVNDGLYDNPDGDGKNNFMEYATGGDPMVADGAAAAIWQAEEGGTNWFYHVHAERLDDPSLSYEVGAKDNLLYNPSWTNVNLEMVGETSGPGTWKTVTNRTDMGTVEYIRLKVDQN